MTKTKKALTLVLVAILLITSGLLAACKRESGDIYVGNTAATTGVFSAVGVPFNIALEAYLEYYNQELKDPAHASVKFKHYDDEFTADKGRTLTEKLVEEDEVFALVGHFGTPTVGATLDYIAEMKVPMVYAATGVDSLYNANATDGERYIFPVQPIFTTEGAIFAARAFAKNPAIGLGFTKVGVIFTNDDAGKGMKATFETQTAEIKKESGYGNIEAVYQQVGATTTAADAPAAVAALKAAGVQCVIIAANQGPMTAIATAMKDGGLDVPFMTSYVNASVTTAGALVENNVLTANRVMYTNAWVNNLEGDDFETFKTIMKEYANVEGTTYVLEETYSATNTNDLRNNAYAMAGYIAAYTFIEGLQRTIEATGNKVTQAAYVEAMESAPMKLPMAGSLDFSNGSRIGLTKLSFFAFGATGAADLTTWKGFADLSEMMAALNS